jgi:coenzyme F420-0:L-glutamate ligase/coenzyme F420-1:gamma-L-glutamate ligase
MTSGTHPYTLTAVAPDGVPEVAPGDDLTTLLLTALDSPPEDGDIVAVTSKVVSKAEGRLVPGTDRDAAISAEAVEVVARRGPTHIVRTRHGLTMAAAGVDNSNVSVGTLALLPVDPDRSAREIREALLARTGRNVAVVVTDTAGRAWRHGQTDIAIGAAGLIVLDDHHGRDDAYGNPLAVTAPAVADEVAAMAELASGKLGGRPFVLVRGLGAQVLPRDEHGPGAAALIRPLAEDLFALGAREAVIRALSGAHADRRLFGAPATAAEVADAVRAVTGSEPRFAADAIRVRGEVSALTPLAFALGWILDHEDLRDLDDPVADVSGDARIGEPGSPVGTVTLRRPTTP